MSIRVPRYQQQESRSALPTPTAQPVPTAQLDQLAQPISQLAQVVVKAQEQAAQIQATDALNELNRRATDRLYNKEGGLFHRKGTDALAHSGDVAKALAADRDEIIRNLPSARARAIVAGDSQSVLDRYHRGIEQYVGGQINQARNLSLNNAEAQAFERIQLGDFADPAEFQATLDALENRYQALADSPEEYEARKREGFRKATNLGMEMWLRSGDLEGAEKFLDTHTAAMGPKAAAFRVQIDEMKKDQAAEVEATALFVKLFDTKTDPDEPIADLSAMRTALRAMAPGPLRDKFEAKLADEERLQEMRVREVGDRARAAGTAADGFRISQVDPKDLMWLKARSGKSPKAGEEYRKLHEMDRQRRERNSKPDSVRNQIEQRNLQQALYDLERMPDSEVEKKDSETLALEYGITDPGLKRSLNHEILKSKKIMDTGNAAAVKQAEDRVMASIEPMLEGKPGEQKEVRENVRAVVKQKIHDAIGPDGRVSAEDLERIVAETTATEITKRTWRSDEVKLSAAELAKRSQETGVPATEIQKAIDARVATERTMGNTRFRPEDVTNEMIRETIYPTVPPWKRMGIEQDAYERAVPAIVLRESRTNPSFTHEDVTDEMVLEHINRKPPPIDYTGEGPIPPEVVAAQAAFDAGTPLAQVAAMPGGRPILRNAFRSRGLEYTEKILDDLVEQARGR